MRSTTDDRPAGGTDPTSAPGKSGNQLLWIVAGVFVIVRAAGTVLFTIAPVPLTTQRVMD